MNKCKLQLRMVWHFSKPDLVNKRAVAPDCHNVDKEDVDVEKIDGDDNNVKNNPHVGQHTGDNKEEVSTNYFSSSSDGVVDNKGGGPSTPNHIHCCWDVSHPYPPLRLWMAPEI